MRLPEPPCGPLASGAALDEEKAPTLGHVSFQTQATLGRSAREQKGPAPVSYGLSPSPSLFSGNSTCDRDFGANYWASWASVSSIANGESEDRLLSAVDTEVSPTCKQPAQCLVQGRAPQALCHPRPPQGTPDTWVLFYLSQVQQHIKCMYRIWLRESPATKPFPAHGNFY